MINLCLVVIATQFSETKRRETERMLAERARRSKHRSQSSSTLASSGGLGVGGCYVELVHYLEYLANRARRRFGRFFRRVRRRYAASQSAPVSGDVGLRRPRSIVASDVTPPRRRCRRRRRHRDLDPRPSDAPVSADNSPRCRAELPDSAQSTHGVVACRVAETSDLDCQSLSVSVPPRRAKLLSVANTECLPISNTGMSITSLLKLLLFSYIYENSNCRFKIPCYV